MNNIFIYEWHELTRGSKITVKLIIQAICLSIAVGLGPNLLFMYMDYNSDISVYQLWFMIIAIPVILFFSILSDWRNPVTEVTQSSLYIDEDTAKVSRHVISDTGRRYYAVWDSLEIKGCKFDEFHKVIQLDATWKVSAFKMKGKKHGAFVDSEVRTYTQTFQLTPEIFDKAMNHLKLYCHDILTIMSPEEYEKAKPFIHKHHEI